MSGFINNDKVSNEEFNFCGCGKPTRYLNHEGKGCCNKHMRCPTYDELRETNQKHFTDLVRTISAARDLYTFKEISDSYKKAERIIDEMFSEYCPFGG